MFLYVNAYVSAGIDDILPRRNHSLHNLPTVFHIDNLAFLLINPLHCGAAQSKVIFVGKIDFSFG